MMPPIVPNAKHIRSFPTGAAFAAWMKANHARADEIWLKVHKKDSGLPSITCAEALDVALCYGWIDGIRKSFDARSFLQRYTPASREKRLEPDQPRSRGPLDDSRSHDAARAAPGRRCQGRRTVGRRLRADPQRQQDHAARRSTRGHRRQSARRQDLRDAWPRTNLFALIFRTNNMKTPEGRARKIATLVAMLARGETIVPERRRVTAIKKR